MRMRQRWIVCGLAAALAACGGAPSQEDAEATADATPGEESAPSSPDDTPSVPESGTGDPADAEAPQAPVAGGLEDEEGNPIPLLPFDVTTVPISTATLGELPFFAMPDGYGPVNRPDVRRFARFPFRIGDGLHWVEGASWNGIVGVARDRRDEKEYSPRELRRNFDAVLAQAGAHKVFEGRLERKLYYGPLLEDEIGSSFIDGVNLDAQSPTTVHVIRQANRNIWVQLALDTHNAGLVVVEEKPFVATARWGDQFPYLGLPEGYDRGNRSKSRDFDMYPFWNGRDFEEVEGRTIAVDVRGSEEARSMHEVRRNLESMVDEAGGVLVFEGRIPKEASDRYGNDLKGHYSDATSFSWHEYESRVYRIDRPDGKQVWIHARLEPMTTGWVVVEREGFRATASLLQADALHEQLDADGRVAIEVHFAVDAAEILPESEPQLEQVVALLARDASLRLAIEGHTDDTGTVARNRVLSDSRARAVMAALVAAGVDAARLSASGFGQEHAVADNATEEGRARNRRVELVRR